MDDGSGPDEPCKTHGLQMYRESIQPIDKTKCVDYIRITDLEGAWHKAGVLDGDLLVQVDNHGQQIMVARANATTNSYDILRFTLPDGIAGAEHYPVYFSEKEINRYNKAISTLK